MAYIRMRRGGEIPPVIKNLLIINALFWLAELTFREQFINLFVLHFHKHPDFRVWQILTGAFLHSLGLSHILFNMFALWMFGSSLEDVWGSKRFLLFYLSCAIGASLIVLLAQSLEFNWYIYQHANGAISEGEFIERAGGVYNTVTLGASGAINGVMAACAYLFPNMEMMIFPLPIPIKIKYVVVVYFLADLFGGINPQTGDNVAHFAHVGGAIIGLILVLTMNKSNRRTFY